VGHQTKKELHMKCRAIFLLFLLSGFSCSKEEDPVALVDDVEPAITEVGTPIGDPVTLEIGPDGGVISSADGLLDVSVPTGAVDANTSFSIQPVTNFCPGGYRAYQLLPEGLTFSKPITLTFHYTDDDLAGTSTEFLGVAFQGSEGEWNLVQTELDEHAMTLRTETTHFSSWVMVSHVVITPQRPVIPKLEIDRSMNLVVKVVDYSYPNEIRPLPRLGRQRHIQATWFVNGVEDGNSNVGTLQLAGNQVSVIYKAPGSVPVNNPVAITAQLSGIRAWDFFNERRVTYNKIILAKHVKIVDEYKFKLTFRLTEPLLGCFGGVAYEDKVELDIHVKGGNATTSGLVNYKPWVSPESQTIGNCTTTCIPGEGILHISSAALEWAGSNDPNHPYPRLWVTLYNDGFNPGFKRECPNTPTVSAQPTPNERILFDNFFELTNDSEQEGINSFFGRRWLLTPKE
jgi:hypothetical protein